MKLLKETLLNDDICVNFFDMSNRYFGDFNRVVVRVEVFSACSGDDSLRYERSLEQMGVPTNMVRTVQDKLIADFLETASRYLCRPGFLEQARSKKKSRHRGLAASY